MTYSRVNQINRMLEGAGVKEVWLRNLKLGDYIWMQSDGRGRFYEITSLNPAAKAVGTDDGIVRIWSTHSSFITIRFGDSDV